MKKTIKHTAAWQPVLLLFIILIFNAFSTVNNDDIEKKSSPDENKISISNSIYSPVSGGQRLDYTSIELPITGRNDLLPDFNLSNKVKESIISIVCSTYIYFSKHIIHVSLTAPDIIYPFHYFW